MRGGFEATMGRSVEFPVGHISSTGPTYGGHELPMTASSDQACKKKT